MSRLLNLLRHRRSVADAAFSAHLRADDLAAEIDAVTGRADLAATAHELDALRYRVAELERRLESAVLLEQIDGAERLIEATPAGQETCISVVLATRDRATLLPRAVASVRAQRHVRWELIVVDDGSVDDTSGVAAQLAATDERIQVVRSEGRGCGHARNVGLEIATGDVVAYLDDDNVMCPGWLAAVAWALDRHPERQLVYGARIVESAAGGLGVHLLLEPCTTEALARGNPIDTNVMAHRRELPGGRFDETLKAAGDWDFVIRACRHTEPLMLHARAAVYTTSSPNRISDRSGVEETYAALRRRVPKA